MAGPTTTAGLTPQYLVAFGDTAVTDPATITTVASPAGTLGAAGVWTDITQYVMSHHIQRGRQHELRQFEAGTCELALNNNDGRFNPWNSSSPYFGLLLPRKLLQVRASWGGTTYTRFTGHVDAWPVDWPDPISGWARLHASDAFRMFNLNNVTSTGYADRVIADGAVGYWRLGDPVGSTTEDDYTGNGHAAISNDGAGSLTFGNSGAIPVDPTSSVSIPGTTTTESYVEAISLGAVSSATGVTMDFLMQLPSAGASGYAQHLVFKFAGSIYGLRVKWGGSGTQILVQDINGVPSSTITSTVNLQDGNWHHLAVSINTSWVVHCYVDGTLMGSHTFGAFNSFTAGMNNSRLASVSQSGTASANYQEWAIYPTILSAGQIAAHHSLTVVPQQSTDARIGRILDIVDWSAGARNLDTGTSTVQAVTTTLVTTSSLAHMQDVEATESGDLYMTTDGKVRFVSRTNRFLQAVYTTSQATIGDDYTGSDLPFDPGPVIAIDDIDLYNEAVAGRQSGNTQRYADLASIAAYGRVTWTPPATLLGTTDTEVAELCEYVVSKYKTPVTRVQQVTVDLLNLIAANRVGTLLALDMLEQITVERVGVPGGGTGLSQAGNIEHIDEQAAPGVWKITFGMALADPPFWILNTSQLNSTTRLAY